MISTIFISALCVTSSAFTTVSKTKAKTSGLKAFSTLHSSKLRNDKVSLPFNLVHGVSLTFLETKLFSTSQSGDSEKGEINAPDKEEVLDQIMDYIRINPDEEQDQDLTPSQITSLVEATFVKACLQLSTGYVDVLKFFIVSVQMSYKSGITAIELLKLLDSCQTSTANRPLMEDEMLLRRIWIEVVYTVLGGKGSDLVGELANPDDADDISKYRQLSLHILTTKQLKPELELSSFDVQEYCKNQGSSSKFSPNNPVEMMFATYAARLAFLTLTVLHEEKNCDDPNAKRILGGPPRPPIPGAF